MAECYCLADECLPVLGVAVILNASDEGCGDEQYDMPRLMYGIRDSFTPTARSGMNE